MWVGSIHVDWSLFLSCTSLLLFVGFVAKMLVDAMMMFTNDDILIFLNKY